MTDLAVALLRCDKPALGANAGNRTQEFDTVVSQASAMMDRVNSDLKMVVAPEYFYSPIGQIGQHVLQDGPLAVSRTEKHDIYDELKKISARNNGVVIVAGSIYYKKGEGAKAKGLNVCPILYNGKIIHKYYKKFDDGALNKAEANPTYSHKDSDPIFNIGGVDFGIEICGDHNTGNNNLRSWLAANGNPPVSVQILISDSMAPNPPLMMARANGYFVQCDLSGSLAAALGVYQSDNAGVFQVGLANSLIPNISFSSGPNLGVSIYSLANA